MICPICRSEQTSFFAEKNDYLFYRCTTCKTIYMPALPSKKVLEQFYKKQFSYDVGLKNEQLIRKRSAHILKKIKKWAPYARTLCDVGSGYGFFLDEAQSTGYRVMGIEPAQKLGRYARGTYGLPTFGGSLESFSVVEKKKYDVVVCIHVVEHVQNPRQFISLLLRLVAPGGLLYIETPNSDSHLLYAEREQYTFLIPPDHLWLFSKKSFEFLLPLSTTIREVHTYSYSEHVMGIMKSIISHRNKQQFLSQIKTEQKHKSNTPAITSLSLRKKLSYLLFDLLLAPLFVPLLSLHHKGSILELYINKNIHKSGL